MSNNIRVRIAPSNSGSDLHVGNVRTALFNYLFAKKTGGQFVFRIENSDTARCKDEYADNIAATLDWLGLSVNEGYNIGGDCGPYMQSQKISRYVDTANLFIERGLAYKCYCSQQELQDQKKGLSDKDKIGFKYPGTCRNRADVPIGKDYVIRLKAPTEGFVEWDDLAFGKIKVPNKENYDWIIVRADGFPLYNWGCCIDDLDQKITHIVRGRDHIINTNIQIIMHEMLGSHKIEYCHLPMMLGMDGAKLSKRHASVSISEYREAGYTPSGILNYLARFGWGFGNQEIFSMVDLIEKFSLEACGKNDGRFDVKKFAAIQFEHLKNPNLTSDDEYLERLIPFLEKKGIKSPNQDSMRLTLPLVRPRAHTLVEAADEMAPFLSDEITPEYKGIPDQIKEKIQTLVSELNDSVAWNEDNLRQLTKGWLIKNNLTLKELGGFMRLSLTGRPNSPELFQVMAALGQGRTVKRLRIGVERLAALDSTPNDEHV